MSKSHGIFTKNFTIFFSKAGKTENVPEFEFEKLHSLSLHNLTYVTSFIQ